MNRDYFGSGNKEKFDWDAVAIKYAGKLNREFIEENILRARVQALRMLTETNNKYWSDYIKYNIKLIDVYGTDTTNAFVDANIVNNFVWDIFIHSSDSHQLAFGLKLSEGVIRRNPNQPNNIDTYANLLYKMVEKLRLYNGLIGQLTLRDLQEMILVGLTIFRKNLNRITNDEPTWDVENSSDTK